jgi:tRNA threonylcarbamoyladenosine biosynthesis protein TsaE
MADSNTFDEEFLSESAEATFSRGRDIGLGCEGGEVLALEGPLGAGKTCFVKGLADGLGIDPRDVTSPTFLLLHELRGRLVLAHLDAYRVDDPGVFVELGFDDLLRADTVVVLEWADRVPGLLPAERLDVHFRHEGEEKRRLRLSPRGARHARLLSRRAGGSP